MLLVVFRNEEEDQGCSRLKTVKKVKTQDLSLRRLKSFMRRLRRLAEDNDSDEESNPPAMSLSDLELLELLE